jgi:hypothetical protein
VNDKLKNDLKGSGSDGDVISRYCPGICLEGLRGTTKISVRIGGL